VAHASASGNRLTLSFDDFIVAAGDTVELALHSSFTDVGTPEFSLSLDAANILATYAAGPLQGSIVAVATDDVNGKVVNETFTLADKNLSGSFLVRNNPFDPLTEPAEFRYYLQKDEEVSFVVLTLTGELVYRRDITAGEAGAAAGENVFFWDGRNDDGSTVINGIYLAIISLGQDGERATIKLAVLK
jgi:flagellar hook assembly protein FlgD